jgi:hypothetical protein
VARKNDSQPRAQAGSGEGLYLFADLSFDLGGNLVAVKDSGSHSVHRK